jgi:uncharacterized protein
MYDLRVRDRKMKKEYKDMEKVGYDVEGKERSGSFMQEDDNVVSFTAAKDGVEILAVEEAIRKYPDLKENYYGKAFKKYGRDFEKDTTGGYFIRVKKGVKTFFPVQTCLFLKKKGFQQKVHNIVIVEEDAKLYLITGCTSAKAAHEAYHLGISEFFIHNNGYLNFTMIHSWKEDVEVQPKSVAVLEENASFISNYISLQPVKKINMYPTALLEGKNAKARFNSIISSHPGSYQDIGSRIVLKDKGCSGEIISRAVSFGGTVIARGHLLATSPDVKAHLECRGLTVTKKGKIHAIPELETDYRDVDLSHEAAIGKVKKDEIEYIASRGIPEDEAQAIIIRGFMSVEILGLPDILQEEIKKITERTILEGL